MLKFKVNKDVKTDVINLKDISIRACGIDLPLVDVKHDVFVETLECLRNAFWYMNIIAQIGFFTDIKGNTGIVAVTCHSIGFYYPENKNQILCCKNGLISLEVINLKSKMILDSELLNKYSSKLDVLYANNVSYIADNGIVFIYNDKLYTLIF